MHKLLIPNFDQLAIDSNRFLAAYHPLVLSSEVQARFKRHGAWMTVLEVILS